MSITESPHEGVLYETTLSDEPNIFDAAYPRVYTASWSIHGAPKFPGPLETQCRAVSPVTDSSWRLLVLNERFGRLSVVLSSYDKLRNYPGSTVLDFEGEVSLNPGSKIRLHQRGGPAWVDFYGASLVGTATMETAFSAPWRASRDGRVCFTGVNTFKRRIEIRRVGFVGDDNHYSFSSLEP